MRAPGHGDGVGGPSTPSRELEALRRALYARGADGAAVDAYSGQRLLGEQGPARVDGGDAPTPGHEPPAQQPEPSTTHRAVARRVRPALGLLAGTTAGLVVGVLLGPLLGGPPARPTTPLQASPLGTHRGTGDVSALAVFSAPQRSVDRPPIVNGATLIAGSFRRLRAVPELAFDVYAARASHGQLCLVAVGRSTELAAACAPEPRFERVPLRLVLRATEGGAGNAPVDVTATWWRIGGLEIEKQPADQRWGFRWAIPDSN